jgi:hypothetical protein
VTKKKPDTKTVVIMPDSPFSTCSPRGVKVTLPRLPWEPKEEVKGEAA